MASVRGAGLSLQRSRLTDLSAEGGRPRAGVWCREPEGDGEWPQRVAVLPGGYGDRRGPQSSETPHPMLLAVSLAWGSRALTGCLCGALTDAPGVCCGACAGDWTGWGRCAWGWEVTAWCPTTRV